MQLSSAGEIIQPMVGTGDGLDAGKCRQAGQGRGRGHAMLKMSLITIRAVVGEEEKKEEKMEEEDLQP